MNSTLRQVKRSLRRTYRRITRSPFTVPDAPAPLLVHSCYHKVGTVWFLNVLRRVGEEYGLELIEYRGGPVPARPGRHVVLDHHSRVDRDALAQYRGSHMIRDPRDVVISGYFYHLRTTEAWALEPRERFGGKSYQEYLKGFDKEQGLAEEIRYRASMLRDMVAWDYNSLRTLEIRYEDHLADERGGFERLFRHYGFSPEAVARSTELALGFSLNKVKSSSSHIRSGRPNEWVEHFTPALKALFKEATGDAALALGYERTGDW